MLFRLALLGLLACCASQSSLAWDYVNHRLVNRLALATLPPEFPAFVQAPEAQERIQFLSGEPDRWRNNTDLTLKHASNPEHFFDFEFAEELGIPTSGLKRLRYDFVEQLFKAQGRLPNVVPMGNPAQDPENAKRLIGFLPWTLSEQHAKLKSAFSYLKAFESFGSPAEITNAHDNIIYLMGVVGHFAGDGSQPLHTTKHYNGWTGENPNGYTVRKSFHARIDGDFLEVRPLDFEAARAKLRPAKVLFKSDARAERADIFEESVAWLRQQHNQVEPLYKLDKEGMFSGDKATAKQGQAFLEKQIISGSQFLGDLWFSAWRESQPDRFLIQRLKAKDQAAK